MNRITGMHFDVMIGDLLVHVEEVTLDIDDATTVNKTKGIPDGVLIGEVSASGEIKLATNNFNKVIELAGIAGSFRELPPFDLTFAADSGDEFMNVDAFGCKLRISSLLSIKSTGSEKNMHTLPYDVTDPNFVRLNGVPYVANREIEDLT